MIMSMWNAKASNCKSHAFWFKYGLNLFPQNISCSAYMCRHIIFKINKMIYMLFRNDHSVPFSDRPMI